MLNDLRRRGVQDVLIACVDGLKGFPEAIEATFPAAAHPLARPALLSRTNLDSAVRSRTMRGRAAPSRQKRQHWFEGELTVLRTGDAAARARLAHGRARKRAGVLLWREQAVKRDVRRSTAPRRPRCAGAWRGQCPLRCLYRPA